MTEIEKLYELAGVEPRCNIYPTFYDCAKYPHEKCEDCVEWEYPQFTAEKQIELIKWLGKMAGKLEISCNYNYTQYLAYFYLNRKTRDEILPNITTGRNENFAECLANLINNLWQDLIPEEQEQIKEILR